MPEEHSSSPACAMSWGEKAGWVHFKSQINAPWVGDQSLIHPSPSKHKRSTPHALFLSVKIKDAGEIAHEVKMPRRLPKQGIIIWLLSLAKDGEVNTSWGPFPLCSMESELEKDSCPSIRILLLFKEKDGGSGVLTKGWSMTAFSRQCVILSDFLSKSSS